MTCMFYSAHCMNIIFNSLLAQLIKYDVYTTHKIKSIRAIFITYCYFIEFLQQLSVSHCDVVKVGATTSPMSTDLLASPGRTPTYFLPCDFQPFTWETSTIMTQTLGVMQRMTQSREEPCSQPVKEFCKLPTFARVMNECIVAQFLTHSVVSGSSVSLKSKFSLSSFFSLPFYPLSPLFP